MRQGREKPLFIETNMAAEVKKENNFSFFSGEKYEGPKQLFCHSRIRDSPKKRRDPIIFVFPR